ncbi:hypothetical protein V7122_02495 [Bacillus sp. JJ1532]|uniref:DUF7210 family protein n=1 Tax=unclassified Bacillus (in: firmicutes) TaxID=185979 RepID=UPI002FFD8204
MSEKKTTKKQELYKITLIKNVKHNDLRYKKGEKTEVSAEDYEVFLKAEVIAAGDDD